MEPFIHEKRCRYRDNAVRWKGVSFFLITENVAALARMSTCRLSGHFAFHSEKRSIFQEYYLISEVPF